MLLFRKCRCGGTGRRTGLKIPGSRERTGSIPVTGTTSKEPDFIPFPRFALEPRKLHIRRVLPPSPDRIRFAGIRSGFFDSRQKSSRAHSAAPPFRTGSASPGFVPVCFTTDDLFPLPDRIRCLEIRSDLLPETRQGEHRGGFVSFSSNNQQSTGVFLPNWKGCALTSPNCL